MAAFFLLLTLALAAAWPALAQVAMVETRAVAGEAFTATIELTGGCEGKPTSALKLLLPAGTRDVQPRFKPDWTLETVTERLDERYRRDSGGTEREIREITWTGGPIPPQAYDLFEIRMTLPDAAGQRLFFEVHQICGDRAVLWNERIQPGREPGLLQFAAPHIDLVSAAAAEAEAP